MKLNQLQLSNFRAFENISLSFNDKMTAIIGINGAGKTSMLDAIAICMTHITGSLLSSSERYNIDAWFQSHDLTNNAESGKLGIKLQNSSFNNGEEVEVNVTKERSEAGLSFDKNPTEFLQVLKNQLKANIGRTIPIIVYFNANRTTEQGTENQPMTKIYNNKLFAYERSLELKSPSFSIFEKWFINQLIEENAYKVREKDFEVQLPSLKFIRESLNEFFEIIEPNTYTNISTINESSLMPDFGEKFNTSLIINKNDIPILVQQLSNGERMVLGLVAEIARRLFIANDSDFKNGSGIVLIDELELHLHPAWQKNIVNALRTVFPKLNFIFTTHSPLILSGIRRKQIKILQNFEEIPNDQLPDIYTASADELLYKLMGTDSKSQKFEKERKEIDILFNETKFDEAAIKLKELKNKIQSSPDWLNDYEQKIAFANS